MRQPEINVRQHQLCFETLANELRLDIIKLLEKGPLNVTTLSTETKAERSRVSHALQILRQCNLVKTQKKGREVLYAVNLATPIFQQHKGNLFSMMEAHARASCSTCAKCGRAPFKGK